MPDRPPRRVQLTLRGNKDDLNLPQTKDSVRTLTRRMHFSLGLMGFSLVGIDQQSRDMKEKQQDEKVQSDCDGCGAGVERNAGPGHYA